MSPCRLLHWILTALLSAGSVLWAASPANDSAQQQPPPPTFRSGVTAVPINVRVLDGDGKPVTGLTQDDFAVFEDDVRQAIAHFTEEVLEARTAGPALSAGPDLPSFDGSPQRYRVFLVVLGAGALGSRPLGTGTRALADPSDALGGLLQFIRTRLLPQDQVALLAYNRATDFSANHERCASVLEAFRRSEEDGRAELAARGRQTPLGAPARSVFATESASPLSPADAGLGLAEYMDARGRPASDGENLLYGIRYLRYVDGEKHLIYVTAQGMRAPEAGTLESAQAKPWDDAGQLAAAANDARVAVHVIQTGGISANPPAFLAPLPIMTPKILLPGMAYFGSGGSGATSATTTDTTGEARAAPQPGWDRPAPDVPVPIPGIDAAGFVALANLRVLASLTGGHASIMSPATAATDRIDAQTRTDYLLAYYPSNTAWDGGYRSIRIQVNRPDVTILFRHGYHAAEPPTSLTRRKVVADGRLVAAGSSTRQYQDIRVTAKSVFTKSRNSAGGEMLVRLVIDTARLTWTTDELSRHVAHLDLAIYCGDDRQRTVGQTRRIINAALTDESHAIVSKEGLSYEVDLPVAAAPRYVKVVVYNFDSDLLGSTVVRMR